MKKYLKQKLINLKNNSQVSFIDILFIFIILMFLFLGIVKAIVLPKDINYYENRPANKFSNVNINDFSNGELQDNIELVLADQIPFSQRMKKYYNTYSSTISKKLLDTCIEKYYNDRYFFIDHAIYKFGMDGNLVWGTYSLENEKNSLDTNINDINHLIEKYPNIKFYLYYIEKDTDINLTTNEKANISEYVLGNINLPEENMGKMEINSFNEFNEFFYKTDHHWNYKGSYAGYLQVLKMLRPNDNPIIPEETVMLSNNFSGSKASLAGVADVYKEPFYVYRFSLPIHNTYVNKIEMEYGHNNNVMALKNVEPISYGDFYGWDDGEVIFDYHNTDADNILILGESFDNANIELIASHFNKTYCVDLRAYEMDLGHKFDFDEYIKENNISRVLFIGNVNFYEYCGGEINAVQ